MLSTAALAQARAHRTYRERVLPAVYAASVPVAVTAWEVPGEPVPFADAVGQPYEPFAPGQRWGRPWGTTWLRVRGTVPADWPAAQPVELVVDLGFTGGQAGFQAEGLVWTPDGRVVKALEPRHNHVRVDAGPGETVDLVVEAASNPDVAGDWDFAPTPLGDLATAGRDPLYTFAGAWLRRLDPTVFALERDWHTLADVMGELPETSTRRARILRALERAADLLDPEDVAGTATAARDALAPALGVTGSRDTHTVIATGHAHIDSAWLWPVRETIRKCARTFSNVLDLMETYDDFVFVASSAQQYAWMQQHYPELFARIRVRVAEGRFVPVGGMWVESDTNLPGGEAMARQFVEGKGFFLRELGVETTEAWLPDSFGYSGALPQIVAASGSDHFLTQKTSWNETNTLPHHTFAWEGIDGTRILAHFPPVDTYNSDLGAAELAHAAGQHSERGQSDVSLVPFGFGDGGGGPTREMVETGLRKADLDGSPRVRFGRPDAFFAEASETLPEPAVWSGEIYLEFHRGTYTSQARTKAGNRRSEHLLREAELWSATAAVRLGRPYPVQALQQAWHTVLLQQFHDILPGSSIAWVHQEAERRYDEVAVALEALIDDAVTALAADDGDTPETGGPVAFNASPFAVLGVPPLAAGRVEPQPSHGAREGDRYVLTGDAVRATFDAHGRLISLVDGASGREVIAPGAVGNDLQLFRDVPNQWDAWDLDTAYRRTPLDRVQTVAVTLEGAELRVQKTVGSSTVAQRIRVNEAGTGLEIETEVDWHERQKLLKLAFGFDVHADRAASEVQFGHVRRATHANTSWDQARFETAAHRWVHVDEPGLGVTVANDRVYGHDITRSTRPGGGTTTLVRESLLRAPLFPDPYADQGRHVFRHGIVVGELLAGVAEGYRLNLPLRHTQGRTVAPLVSVDNPAVVVEAVKLAEDGSGDVVVRLYEARGGRATAVLTPGFASTGSARTDLLERTLPDQPADPCVLTMRAFELVTLRLARAA
ncbi:MAG: alpha-mannosidase [Friedmanniella sp.]|nr:alpha-mannosidase [Friedmanniella sp.]